MDYLIKKIKDFEAALAMFNKAFIKNPSRLEKDGAIQRFEYCYELCWRTLKLVVEDQGRQGSNSPKAIFRESYLLGLIENEKIWLEIVRQRNLSVHTYNADLADELYLSLPKYALEMADVLNNIKKMYPL